MSTVSAVTEYVQTTFRAFFLLAVAIATHPIHAQVRVKLLKGERLTFEAREESGFRLSMTSGKIAMEVKLDGSWRDLETDDGALALKKSVGYKAGIDAESLLTGFIPEVSFAHSWLAQLVHEASG